MEHRWKDAIDRRMEPAVLSEEARERILRAAQKKGAVPMKKRRIAVLAAALAAVCVATAAAGGPQSIWDMIRQSLTSAGQESGMTTLNLTASDAGYTVTLDRLQGDGQHVYLTGRVIREDGQPFVVDQLANEKFPAFRGSALDLNLSVCTFPGQEEASSWGWETMGLSDSTPDDDVVEFVIGLSADQIPLEGEAVIEIDQLQTMQDEVEQEIAGKWAFTVPLTRTAFGETREVGLEIDLPTGTVTLESIYCGAMDLRAQWEDPEGLISDWLGSIFLVTETGDRIPCGSWYGETLDFAPFNLGLGHVAPDELAAIEVDGQTYPLPTQK